MLQPMNLAALLLRRQASEAAQVDIIIVAYDVCVAMMDRIMLSGPDVGTGAQQIETQRHQLVDPAPLRVGPMSAVVLDVEADRRHRQTQRKDQRHGQPPGLYDEHEMYASPG